MVPYKETQVDVLVCGAGSGGCSAAIAAAECGADVMLIDQNGFFGGTLVMSMTGGFCGIYAAKHYAEEIPEYSVGGVGRRILDGVERSGGLSNMSVTPMFNTRRYDPYVLELVYDRLIMGAGVKPLLHTHIVDAEAEDGKVIWVEVSNKSGRQRIFPKFVIDATGDADIVWMTGGKYRKNVTELQPASYNFRVSGVPAGSEIPNLPALAKRIAEIKAEIGSLGFTREDPMFLQSPDYTKETICCFNRITLDATDAEALTMAEIQGRSEVLPALDFIKTHFPAFKDVHISSLPSYIGVRETRVIEGRDSITIDDVVEGKPRKDGIGRCGWPVERHIIGQPKSELIPVQSDRPYYDIPFGAMIPAGYKNMVIAGRSVSSDRAANASVRVFGPCTEMGQAAGTAAAIYLKCGCTDVSDLDIDKLRSELIVNGALL